jgi:hypothetical protein
MMGEREKIALPYEHVYVNTGEPNEEIDLVEFRLLFEGNLPSSGNRARAEHKHAIRQKFHPQLRRLWQTNPNLRQLASHKAANARSAGFDYQRTVDENDFDRGIRTIGHNWSKAGFDWVPLITSDMVLRCSIDILILRPEGERYIFTQGDIDGQVKTLLDALQMPRNAAEADNRRPDEDENPFFCLLENDRLVSEVKVTADHLLLLPNQKEVGSDDAFVVTHVKANHRHARSFDNYFG